MNPERDNEAEILNPENPKASQLDELKETAPNSMGSRAQTWLQRIAVGFVFSTGALMAASCMTGRLQIPPAVMEVSKKPLRFLAGSDKKAMEKAVRKFAKKAGISEKQAEEWFDFEINRNPKNGLTKVTVTEKKPKTDLLAKAREVAKKPLRFLAGSDKEAMEKAVKKFAKKSGLSKDNVQTFIKFNIKRNPKNGLTTATARIKSNKEIAREMREQAEADRKELDAQEKDLKDIKDQIESLIEPSASAIKKAEKIARKTEGKPLRFLANSYKEARKKAVEKFAKKVGLSERKAEKLFDFDVDYNPGNPIVKAKVRKKEVRRGPRGIDDTGQAASIDIDWIGVKTMKIRAGSKKRALKQLAKRLKVPYKDLKKHYKNIKVSKKKGKWVIEYEPIIGSQIGVPVGPGKEMKPSLRKKVPEPQKEQPAASSENLPDSVKKKIKRAIRKSYESTLKRRSDFRGKISITFLLKKGKVDEIELEGNQPPGEKEDFKADLLERLRYVTFPEDLGKITYPTILLTD